jgi:hypothetical protein
MELTINLDDDTKAAIEQQYCPLNDLKPGEKWHEEDYQYAISMILRSALEII